MSAIFLRLFKLPETKLIVENDSNIPFSKWCILQRCVERIVFEIRILQKNKIKSKNLISMCIYIGFFLFGLANIEQIKQLT